MTTTISAKTSQPGSAADLLNPLGQAILRNLAGDGCCPLDYLGEARASTTELAAFLLAQHSLPNAVALELEAAQLAMQQAELHLRMAAARCN